MLRSSSSLVRGVARRRRTSTLSTGCSKIRRAPSHEHHPQSASCCSFSTDNTKNSPREEHERRVAAAQALVKERRQNHEEKLDQGLQQKQQRKMAKEQKHKEMTLANSVAHWLFKDPSFFAATMEALNLTSKPSSHSKNESSTNNEDHPIQVMWDQYRQLYYESIPTFREQMDGSASKLQFDFQNELGALDEAGFGDPKWGKRYRQVRGYRVKKINMIRQAANAKEELEEQQPMIRRARAELVGLKQEMEIMKQSRERKRKERQAASSKAISSAEQEDSNQSIVSKAWSMILNLVSPTDKQNADEESLKAKRRENTPSSIRTPMATRIEKRIARKELGLKHLADDADDAAIRLEHLQKRQKKRPPPMSEEEYNRANEIVEQVRTSICEKLAEHIRQRHEKLIQQFQTMDAHTDLTKPHEWYSYARLDRRKIIFHGGPTNSGKTYSALERLKDSEHGLYLAPLRLLAAEVYETLTVDGIYTNLFTGQERRAIPFSTHASATVEMCSVDEEYDVVVVDEIQMIADAARGAAWTKALLALRCKEIHVCGGWEAKDIVEKIAKACGDEFEVQKYERFGKLEVAKQSLSNDPTKVGSYKHVQPGDCVVAFSRNDIFAIKREIETSTNYKCCVVYGKLPPQTRADQARLFNDPNSGYDILVASDAIGMGLNLNIRRIIFNSMFKFNGEEVVRLSHSDIKQISGRAGRRNSPYPDGEVTCRDPRDLSYIHLCLSTEIESIEKAGLLPTAGHIELFSEALGAYNLDDDHRNLHQILRQFSALATVQGDYFLCRQTEMRSIAKRLKHLPIPLRDAYTMCLSPTTEKSVRILENFAWKYSQGQVSGLPSRSVPKKAKSFDDLSYLCGLYADADLFLWLQLKFPPSNAVETQAALARKEKTLEFINEALDNTDKLKLNHSYVRQATRHRAVWEAANVNEGGNGDGGMFDDGESSDDDEYSEEEQAVYM